MTAYSFSVAAEPKRPDAPALAAILAELEGADLVVFAGRGGAKQAPRLLLATTVRAPVERLRALFGDLGAYRRAIPAFVRAELLLPLGGGRTPRGARLVGWELEIPLWNLEGKLWHRPRPDGVDLEFVEGDFAPSLFRLTALPDARGALLIVDATAHVRDLNWLARRLVGRSPLAEPAMAAAATWVLLRALALAAEAPGAAPDARRRPVTTMSAPSLDVLDGSKLARALIGRLDPAWVTAAVRSRSDGRLGRVEVGIPLRVDTEVAVRSVAEPARWRALPGWKQVTVLREPRADTSATPERWEVDSQFPFVNFDAVWETHAQDQGLRGRTIAGDTRGAVLAWDALPRQPSGVTLVFSMHPRLEKTGYLPRKFIEAEPLMEQGLSLGLAYVDAVSLVRTIDRTVQGAQ